MLILFALQIAASAATPPPQLLKPLVSGDDYPRLALLYHLEGEVDFDLKIARDGKPVACTIVKSSGYDILDDATCDLVMKRARFAPAKNKDGQPIEGHYKGHIGWRIAR